MNVLPNTILRGPVFPEPAQVIVVTSRRVGMQIIGRGLNTNQVYDRILTPAQIRTLEASPETEPSDGSPRKFRLGIEALRLDLAYEYDPWLRNDFRCDKYFAGWPAFQEPGSVGFSA